MCWYCEALGTAALDDRPLAVEGLLDTATLLPIEIAALLRSAQPGWNYGNDAPQTVTFSFAADPLANRDYARSAFLGEWAPFSEAQRASARQALAAWGADSGLRFLEVADVPAGAGVDVRFSLTELGGDVAGRASYPRFGEVWLDLSSYRGESLSPGTAGFQVLLHEVGHALGFKHSFEDGAVLPVAQDSTANTVMSYNWVGPPRTAVGPYDVAAAQYVYGTRVRGDAVPVQWSFDAAASAVRIAGTEGADVVRGPDYPRTFIALGGGGDVAVGGAGRDWIAPGSGAGTVQGGAGVDTLETPAARLLASLAFTESLSFAVAGGGTLASRAGSLTGGGAAISFREMETFAFLDGRLVFDPADPLAQAARLYRAALGRAPDPDGLNAQAVALEHGADLATVARGFTASPEYAARYAAPADADFVRLLYRNALGREAAAADLRYYEAVLASGQTREQVLANVSESAENRLRTAAPLAAGLWDQDEQAATVARLYRAVLDRAPDEGGLRFHLAALDRGEAPGTVANGFAASPEFASRFGAPDAEGFVRLLYRNTLAREPDAAETAFHVARLAGVAGPGDALLGFSESPEFHARTMATIEGGIVFA